MAKFRRKPKPPKPPTPGSPDVEIRAAMIGFWKEPFGIPFISFGNIQYRARFDPMKKAPEIMAIGGEIWLGKAPKSLDDTDGRIKGAFFAGYQLSFPFTENYLYASVTTLTIQSVANMLVGEKKMPQLPSFIGDNGLHPLEGHEGVLVSFSPVDIQIEDTSPPITIRAGLRIQGKYQMWDYYVIVDITLDWIALKMDMFIAFKPLRLAGGLLEIFHSKTNTNQGPTFVMRGDFKKSLMPNVTMDAYVKVLGISVEVHFKADKKGFSFTHELNLFNLIKTRSEVSYQSKPHKRVLIRGEVEFGSVLKVFTKTVKRLFEALTSRRRRLSISNNSTEPHNSNSIAPNQMHHYRRRLGLFSFIKKSGKAIGGTFKDYGKKVARSYENGAEKLAKGGKAIGKGDFAGGLKHIGGAAFSFGTALIPVWLKLKRASFEMEIIKAKKKTFTISFDINLVIYGVPKTFDDVKLVVDLDNPQKAAAEFVEKTKDKFTFN